MTAIDDIKSRIDIVDLASETGVKLRRSGRTYTGFCPFHQNTRTPAFVIWPDTGTWRCFGECGEGGDIFKFVMKKEGVDFKEALHRLAERAGVQLETFQPEKPEQREEHQRLLNLLEDAVTFYRHQLLNTPAGKTALAYLQEKRKLTMQTIEAFGLGYAPQSWDASLNYFKSKGYSEHDVFEVGLLAERDSGGYYDKFRHRIMIPIRDENGKMAGFGGRILDPNDLPKFMNSPQTALFDKGRLLYGLDRARKPIRAADQAVIVEGYLDVIAVHQAGFENVVSPMGTALTEDQMRLLKRFTRKIVLALDPDAAGQKAVLRGLDAARASLDRGEELAFDARGYLRHEARLQADLRVANMPDGLDPDEIVERNKDEWRALIAGARPIVEHVLDTLVSGQNASDPKVKAEIVAQMLPLIEDLPNPVERDSYRQMVARRLKVDERTLSGAPVSVSPVRRRPVTAPESPREQKKTPVASQVSPFHKIESLCLAILLHRPDLLPKLDRRLQEAGLAALNSADFEYTDHQMLLKLLQQALEQDAAEMPHFVRINIGQDLQESYQRLHGMNLANFTDDGLFDELLDQTENLRRRRYREQVDQLRFLQEEETDPVQLQHYAKTSGQYGRLQSMLDKLRKKDPWKK